MLYLAHDSWICANDTLTVGLPVGNAVTGYDNINVCIRISSKIIDLEVCMKYSQQLSLLWMTAKRREQHKKDILSHS